MPSIELTETLRSKIKELRKNKKKRGDDLSRELGKGASYISQLENGKIKEIDFDLLDSIFRKITDLSESQYNEFLDNLLNDTVSHMSKEELQHEKWMHQFNHEIRRYPITDELVSFIQKQLFALNCSPEDFVEVINQNRGMDGVDLEPNKLNIEIIDKGNGGYGLYSSIIFKLPSDFITKIVSKKTTTISYINMEGILYNLFISLGNSPETAHAETDKLLYSNKFYTIRERNRLIRDNLKEKKANKETFTFYDIQPTDYDKKYVQLRNEVDDFFNILRDKDIVYTCNKLEDLKKNMDDDLPFIIAIMSSPVHKIDSNLKSDFWNDYRELVLSYIKKNESK